MTSIILFTLCIVGILFLLLSFFPKNSNFLDIRSIFIQHLKVFQGNLLQLISIYIIPILFSICITHIRCVGETILNNLNIVLSIFLTMFFSTLSILCSMDGKTKGEKYQQLLNETFTATIFEIIICLTLLLISFITLFVNIFDESYPIKITSFVIYYLTIVAILNILVIIKRIKVLFDNR